MKIGVPKERVEGEQRVALVPETVGKLTDRGFEVLIESGAGRDYNPDKAYEEAGARIASATDLYEESEMILKIQKPTRAEVQVMREGMVLICFLQGPAFPELTWWLAKAGVTVFSVEAIPRVPRAQGIDALSAMESIAGYKSVMIGGQYMVKGFPKMSTTAGSTEASKVLVLGGGVAGLHATATARSLGADVMVFDTRSEVKDRVESLGATFLEEPQETPPEEEEEPKPTGFAKLLSNLNLFVDSTSNETTKGVTPQEALTGADVYAHSRSDEEQQRDRGLIREVLGEIDLVISTVLLPGQKAPILLTGNMAGELKPGSVIVDLAAESGGNCELTEPGRIIEHQKVKIIGPVNVPGSVPAHASQLYSHSMFNFLGHITQDGELAPDFSDQITDESCIVHNGEIRHGLTVEALQEAQKDRTNPESPVK